LLVLLLLLLLVVVVVVGVEGGANDDVTMQARPSADTASCLSSLILYHAAVVVCFRRWSRDFIGMRREVERRGKRTDGRGGGYRCKPSAPFEPLNL